MNVYLNYKNPEILLQIEELQQNQASEASAFAVKAPFVEVNDSIESIQD